MHGESRDGCPVPPEGGSVMPRGKDPDYRIEPETGCWLWLRYIDGQGCPRVSRSKTVPEQRAHREYWRRQHGPIPYGHDVKRRCSTRGCVNPAHHMLIDHAARLAEVHQAASPLTLHDVRAIRAAAKAGVKQEVLCRRYGITSASMSNIVTGRTWKDVNYEPGVERQCALEECGKRFVTRRSNQRFCCAKHRSTANSRAQHPNSRARTRILEAKARTVDSRNRLALKAATSLDRRIDDSGATLGHIVTAPHGGDDPVVCVAADELRELLDGLTDDDVAKLSDRERHSWMRRLLRSGFAPSVAVVAARLPRV